jgi:hypothetical protein
MILEDSSKIRKDAQVEWPGLFGGYCSVHETATGVGLVLSLLNETISLPPNKALKRDAAKRRRAP